jgi:diguanylate cyclase (GGDEF)-like protein/PAS domain S-box-containing protein
VERRTRQQRAIAELGQAALTGVEVPLLLGQTCALVEFVLEPFRCSITEHDANGFVFRFFVGAKASFDLCGGAHPSHQPMLESVLASAWPVVLTGTDPSIDTPHLLSVHGIVSGAAVRISGRRHPFGVLEVLYDRQRAITEDELEFLKAVADLTGSIIDSARDREALASSEQRFRSLIENSSDGIVLMRHDGTISYAGPSTARIIGYAEEELVGTHFTAILHEDDVPAFLAVESEILDDPQTPVASEIRIRDGNGEWRWFESVCRNLLDDPAVGSIVINYRDITERKDVERQLEILAYRDNLTGLPNRFLFNDRIETALEQARRRAHALAILYLDLDRFKLVNDTLGHAVGDRLLQSVASRLESSVRSGDTIARLAGDEFAILIPDIADTNHAGIVARKILDALNEPFMVDAYRLYAPASIGVSVYPYDGKDAASLLKNADSALYRAKELGRNNVQLFTAAMNDRYRERLDIELRLRRALERNQLDVAYQPIIDNRTGEIHAFEALLRWQDNGKSVSPSIFVPVAEETGLITVIAEWALHRVCSDLRRWRSEGAPHFCVSVNLSAHQMREPTLLQSVGDIVSGCGLSARDLYFEVTESVALENLTSAMRVLGALREMGVRVAVDDFGTGQSSLVYLKRLPIDMVKLDREFLQDTRESSGQALLGSIINLVHSLNLYVIAEGIETPAELQILRSLGCDGMQGFVFSPAIPASAVPSFRPELDPRT